MYQAIVNDQSTHKISPKEGQILVDGEELALDIHAISATIFHVIYEQTSYKIEALEIDYAKKTFLFNINGKQVNVQLKSELDTLLENLGMDNGTEATVKEIYSPMPGLIRAINVEKGDTVAAGENLLTLEAMKMENSIKSPVAGVVASIEVKPDQSVEKNQLLISFE